MSVSKLVREMAIAGVTKSIDGLVKKPVQLANTVAILGADIMAQYYLNDPNETSYRSSGIVTWAMGLSGRRLEIVASPAADGCTVIERNVVPNPAKPSLMGQLDIAIAAGAASVWVMMGVNDLLLGTPLTSIQKGFSDFFAKANEYGIRVVAMTHTPYQVTGTSAYSMQQALHQLNRWLKMEGALRPGVRVIDAYSLVAAAQTGISNYAAAATQSHAWKTDHHRNDHRTPNNIGAFVIGEALANDVIAVYPPRDPLINNVFDTIAAIQPHSDNLVDNPGFTDCSAILAIKISNGGTGFTNGAPVTFGNAGSGNGAVFTAVVTGGVITGFTVGTVTNSDGSTTAQHGRDYAPGTTVSVAGGTGLVAQVQFGPVGWTTGGVAPTVTTTARSDGCGNDLNLRFDFTSGTTIRSLQYSRTFGNIVGVNTSTASLIQNYISTNDTFQAMVELKAGNDGFTAGGPYLTYWKGVTHVLDACKKESTDKPIPKAFTAIMATPPAKRPTFTTDFQVRLRTYGNTGAGEFAQVAFGKMALRSNPVIDIATDIVKRNVKFTPGHYVFLQPGITFDDWLRGAYTHGGGGAAGPHKGDFNTGVYTEWNSTTAYAVNDVALDPVTKHVYICLQAHTNQPFPAMAVEGNSNNTNAYWRRTVQNTAAFVGIQRLCFWRRHETTKVQSIDIENGGSGLSNVQLTVVDPGIVRNGTTYMAGGSGAVLTPVVVDGVLTDVVVNNKGDGYTPNAYLQISSSSGGGVVASVNLYDFSSIAEDLYQLDRWKNKDGTRVQKKLSFYFSPDSYNSQGAERVPHYWLVDPIYRDSDDYPDSVVGYADNWTANDTRSIGVTLTNLVPNVRQPRMKINSGGSGYQAGTTVTMTFRSPSNAVVSTATATAIISGGVITGFTGYAYTSGSIPTDFNTSWVLSNTGGGTGFDGIAFGGGAGGKVRYHNKPTQDRIIAFMKALSKAKAKKPIFSGNTETGFEWVTFDDHPALEMIRFEETANADALWIYGPNKSWNHSDGWLRILSYTNSFFKCTTVSHGLNFLTDLNLPRFARIAAKAGVSTGVVDMIPADKSINNGPLACLAWIKAVGRDVPIPVHCDGINYKRNWIGGAQYPDETLVAAISMTGVTHMVWSQYSNAIYSANMASSFDEVPIFLNSLADQATWESNPTGTGLTITSAYPNAHASPYTVNTVNLPATIGLSAALVSTRPYGSPL